jgi:hypothetical protein
MTEKKKTRLDPVAEVILELVAGGGLGKSISPNDAAHEFAKRQWEPTEPPPGEWRQYLLAVKQQALFLARSGRIALLRKGKPADPAKPVKGLYRLGPVQ